MKIQNVFANYSSQNKINFSQNINSETNKNTIKQNQYPTQSNLLNYKYYQNKLNFLSFEGDNRNTRRVPDIDYFEYKSLSSNMKQILRKKCIEFNKDVNLDELKNEKKAYLPLMDDRIMEEFLKVCDLYRGLKDEPILCLGRSPKWFLNTALWMKDGIDDYKFVAFSKNWYRYDRNEGLIRMDRYAPTPEEKRAYKRYLKGIQADPQHIVNVHKKTGKKL